MPGQYFTKKEAQSFFITKKENTYSRTTRLIGTYQALVDALTHATICSEWASKNGGECEECGKVMVMMEAIEK